MSRASGVVPAPAPAGALRLEGVHKSFGKTEVLRGVDLPVDEHEVICLIGASGSGKSTILRCVNLLEPIDEGRIFLAGADITDLARKRYREGVSTYLEVLDAERNLFASEQTLIELRRAQVDNLVTLYVALGGGLVERR